jgi:hypothetical protein
MRPNKVLATLLFAALSCAAQTTTSTRAYDNFKERFLSPERWSSDNACFTANGLEQECVRDIEDGKLRLAHRNFGQRDSDTGFQFGSSAVSFVNPTWIRSITTDVVVRSIVESSCSANPQLGAAAHIDATFFNTGTGDPNDDIGGHLALGRVASDPPGQLTVYGQISQGNNYYYYLFLGTVAMGTPVTATLTWDQPNHRFLVAWTNRITNATSEGTMPYSFADTTPATGPYKVLTVNTFPANCTAKAAWVYIDAAFGNVYVNWPRAE